ncbi:class I SAM-dependent methyltransferase [Kribbella sindirgiensis]|nr:class I SAM-dependent methyltransferase [Kribbella sindirgiensis]
MASWTDRLGEVWAVHQPRFDRMLARYNGAFLAMTGISRTDQVLDIGCGTGTLTRAAAELAPSGRVLGIDLSPAVLAVARKHTRRQSNVSYLQADAESYPLRAQAYQAIISRFGTMYFRQPATAFHRIGQALQDAGQLTMLVWQTRDRNEWVRVIDDSLGPRASHMFGWTDDGTGGPEVIDDLLANAGFDRIAFTDVRQPLFLGVDAEEADMFVRAVVSRDPHDRRQQDELRAALTARQLVSGGVLLNSAAWLVTARKA